MVEEFVEKILIVDDEQDLREIMREELQALGLKVVDAAHGTQALELLEEHPICLIVSDFRMPGMNGVELCKKVKEQRPNLSFVILTGFADKDMVLNSMREGVSEIVEKPLEIARLVSVVQKYIDKRKKEIHNEEEEMLTLRNIFATEGKELFSDIDKWILRLEDEPLDSLIVDTVFRKAHTLKGSAGAFPGAEVIAKVVHTYENVLTALRDKKLAPSSFLVDLLLTGADNIRVLLEDFSEGRAPSLNPEELIIKLKEFIANKNSDIANINQPQTLTTKSEVAAGTIKLKETQATQATEDDEAVLVNNEKITTFMELSGELIVFKNTWQTVMRKYKEDINNDDFSQVMDDFNHALDKISESFQKQIMEIRKVTLEKAFIKFPRIVRQIAQDTGKKIKYELIGADLGVDKTIARALGSSLVHMIRNSADHGIEAPATRVQIGKSEEGKITLTATQIGDTVNIKIEDDGNGISKDKVLQKALEKNLIDKIKAASLTDTEIFDLLFLSGFSTAEKVTNVSGRGVGMDVVKNEVQKINGTVTISSTPGKGSCFTLNIPVPKTVMVEDSVLVKSGNILLAVPLTNISQITSFVAKDITKIQGVTTYQFNGKTIPVGYYTDFLHCNSVDEEHAKSAEHSGDLLVMLTHKGETVGIRVDYVVEQLEAVIRPFDKVINKIPGFKGTSILSNEKIAYVVNAEDLVAIALAKNAVLKGELQ